MTSPGLSGDGSMMSLRLNKIGGYGGYPKEISNGANEADRG